ncbi:MAG: hypothetical protein HY369_04375 [Candidatus Aenigmarchaeota archaeon]|nr:hypothetical protein [Candidatus Aenigmarchaeota archaeon]
MLKPAILALAALGCGPALETYGTRDLGDGHVYLGPSPEAVQTYEDALARVRQDTGSGMLLVGFSPEDVRVVEDVVARYRAIQPAAFERLEPVLVKVESYHPTPEELAEYDAILAHLEGIGTSSLESLEASALAADRAMRLFDLRSRVNPFFGMTESNVPDLGRALQNYGKLTCDVVDATQPAEVAEGDYWRAAAYHARWTAGEITVQGILEYLRRATPAPPDGWDVIYWTGAREKDPLGVVAHEFGHILNGEDPDRMSGIVERFAALNADPAHYLTRYAKGRAEFARGLSPFETWLTECYPSILEDAEHRVQDARENVASAQDWRGKYLDLLEVTDDPLSDPDKEGRRIATRATIQDDISRLDEEIRLGVETLGSLELRYVNLSELPGHPLVQNALQEARQAQNAISEGEDLAEAFRFAVLGGEPDTDAAREKVSLVRRYLQDGLDARNP